MHSQSLSSIAFVITAVYAVTFANSIYLMTVSDPDIGLSLTNIEFEVERSICGVIALILTLRFFFGNNQYIADVMRDVTRTPWVRFYHFLFIAIQSIILLIASYSIADSSTFIYGITGLFGLEVLWYFLTMLVDRKGVLLDDPKECRAFFWAEMTNIGFVAGVALVSFFLPDTSIWWLLSTFMLFLLNSAYDARKNMATYMATEA